MNSGERRGTILLVILIVVLISGMLLFYRRESSVPQQAPPVPRIPDTVKIMPSSTDYDRKRTRHRRNAGRDSVRAHGKKKSGCSHTGYTGRSRDYLDEPAD